MTNHEELEKRIEDLETKINHLTTFLSNMHQKENKVVHYHIKHLEIQSAQIEKMDYHLDSIGIEQLSGTLNIGNNFNKEKGADSILPSMSKEEEFTSKNFHKTQPTPPYHSQFTKKRKNAQDSNQLKVTERKRGFSIALNQKEEK